jgi:hypothetical protein
MPTTTLVLRSLNKTSDSASAADFYVKMPNHLIPSEPFYVQLVGLQVDWASGASSCSVHCSYGDGGSFIWDSQTGGRSDCLAVVQDTTQPLVPGAKVLCRSAGAFDRVRVVLRNPSNYVPHATVSNCTLILQITRVPDNELKF